METTKNAKGGERVVLVSSSLLLPEQYAPAQELCHRFVWHGLFLRDGSGGNTFLPLFIPNRPCLFWSFCLMAQKAAVQTLPQNSGGMPILIGALIHRLFINICLTLYKMDSLFIQQFFQFFFQVKVEMETEENRLGDIQGGATLEYKPTYYTVNDDLGLVKDNSSSFSSKSKSFRSVYSSI